MLNFDASYFKPKFEIEKARERIKSDIEYLNELELMLDRNASLLEYDESDYVSEKDFDNFLTYYRTQCYQLKERFNDLYPNWPKKDQRSILLIRGLGDITVKVEEHNYDKELNSEFVSKNRFKEKIYCFINCTRKDKFSDKYVYDCEAISENGKHLLSASHQTIEECLSKLGFYGGHCEEKYKKWYPNGYELIWLGHGNANKNHNGLKTAIRLHYDNYKRNRKVS